MERNIGGFGLLIFALAQGVAIPIFLMQSKR